VPADVLANEHVGLVQISDGFVDLFWPVALVFPCVDIDDADAVYLGGVADEPVTLGVEQLP
jgi:hypothetical protein